MPTYLCEGVPHHDFSRRFYGFPSSNSLEVRATTQAFRCLQVPSGAFGRPLPQSISVHPIPPLFQVPPASQSDFSLALHSIGFPDCLVSRLLAGVQTRSQVCFLWAGPFRLRTPQSTYYIMVLCHFDLFPTSLFHLAALQPLAVAGSLAADCALACHRKISPFVAPGSRVESVLKNSTALFCRPNRIQ